MVFIKILYRWEGSTIDLHQLKTFYYVAKHLNFSRAAEEVSLTQPAVSRQIETLEKHFGLDLFYRVGKKIELTDAGRRLVPYAENMLQYAKSTEKAMASLKKVDEGELVIGAGTTVGNYVLSPIIAAFTNQYPKIKVKLMIHKTSDIIERINKGTIDIAIIAKSGKHPEFQYDPLFKDDVILLASAKKNIYLTEVNGLHELKEERFFLREKGSNTRECVDALFQKSKFSPKEMLEFETNEAIKLSIIKGFGIGFLSRSTVQLELEQGLLKQIPIVELCGREFSLIQQKGKYISPIIQRFTVFLKDHLNMQQ